MDIGLAGKRAIITGASRGIGLEIARTLVAEGASVAICARGKGGVDAAVAELTADGGVAWGDGVDVADGEAYEGFLGAAVDQLGGVDIFIANIALTPEADDETLWQTAYDIDLMHAVRGCRTLIPSLQQGADPSVVMISSVANVMADVPPTEGPYGALKAAMVSHAAQLAQQYEETGVRVNCVSPGPVIFEGGTWDEIRKEDPDTFEWAQTLPAVRRLGQPDEIARVVTFLASPAASFVTGANWRVDGGTIKTANF